MTRLVHTDPRRRRRRGSSLRIWPVDAKSSLLHYDPIVAS
jgi:hypothetical protein